jgi:hypothetical protein
VCSFCARAGGTYRQQTLWLRVEGVHQPLGDQSSVGAGLARVGGRAMGMWYQE